MKQTERACLAIADISGYTAYLAGVELDHAQDVLADLLSAIVSPLRPTFQLIELEGDAAFMYAPVEEIDGSILLDLVESSYFNFRRRLLSIQQASSCQCDACLRIPELDLKVVVHHGSVVRQEILGQQKLVGSDVIVPHRLLKNRIVEQLGVRAYALLTDACIAATGLDAALLGMTRHEESYEHVGVVGGWVHDLQRTWQVERERRRVYVSPQDAIWTGEGFIPDVPAALVWEWMTTPTRRLQWELGFDDIVEAVPEGGRRGVGAETHCIHGEDVIRNEVLDWRPPRYVTNSGQFPGGVPYIVTDEVVPQEGGVVARKSLKAPTAETRPQLEEVLDELGPMLDQWMHTLVELVSEEYASGPPVSELPLPVPDESARLASAVQTS